MCANLTMHVVQFTVIVDAVLVVLSSSCILLACGQIWRVVRVDINTFPEHVRATTVPFIDAARFFSATKAILDYWLD